MYFLRRMHGLMPNGRAHQQKRCGDRDPLLVWTRKDSKPKISCRYRSLRGSSGTFPGAESRRAIVKRRFRKGEIICREGEFGSTAFYILEGQAKVSISTPIAHVKTQGGAKGFFKRLTSTLAAP